MAKTAVAPAKPQLVPGEIVRISDLYNEAWLEDQIRKRPELLGLPDGLKVASPQVRQASGGRLDLLLHDEENEVVYAVELMLGTVDASHVVRCLDYFLRERKRKGRDEWSSVAVLVAEDVRGSRYMRVLDYLSRRMPLIVVELCAIRVGSNLVLKPTRIFDGTEEEEGPVVTGQSEYSRDYWINKSSVELVDLAESFIPASLRGERRLTITYRKQFIGTAAEGVAENFLYFKPKKTKGLKVHARIADRKGWVARLADAGLNLAGDGMGTGTRIRFYVTPQQFKAYQKLLAELCETSCSEWFG